MSETIERAGLAIGPGAFVGVVGASGVGKDAVLGYARASAPDGVVFVRRAITRPPGPGEGFRAMSTAEFDATDAAGGFAVSWRAHGLRYGLPASVDDVVLGGGIAVANVSRTALGELAARYGRFRLVRVSAPAHVRGARLAARGREGASDIARRIDRPDPAPDAHVDLEIVNDGPLADAGEVLLGFLTALAVPHRG